MPLQLGAAADVVCRVMLAASAAGVLHRICVQQQVPARLLLLMEPTALWTALVAAAGKEAARGQRRERAAALSSDHCCQQGCRLGWQLGGASHQVARCVIGEDALAQGSVCGCVRWHRPWAGTEFVGSEWQGLAQAGAVCQAGSVCCLAAVAGAVRSAELLPVKHFLLSFCLVPRTA